MDMDYLFDVLDGTHETDRLQIQNIEGLSKVTHADWLIRFNGSTIEGIRTATGAVISSSTTDLLAVFNTLVADSNFTDGDTVLIRPSAVVYPVGVTATAEVAFTKSATIWGYGATLQANASKTNKYLFNIKTAGKSLTIYGLTFDLNYPAFNYLGAIKGEVDGSGNGIDIGGFKLYDCTVKNCYGYAANVGSSATADITLPSCTIRINNCVFDNTGVIGAAAGSRSSIGELLRIDGAEHFSMTNCHFYGNELFHICARHNHVSSIYGDTTPAYDNKFNSTLSGQHIMIRNVHLDGFGLTVKPYGNVGAGHRFASCKNCVVDGLTVVNTGAIPLAFEPYDDTFKFENISCKNLWIGSKSITIRSDNDDSRHSKADMVKVEDYVLDTFDSNNALVVVKNCDVQNMMLDNLRPNAGWNVDGAIVAMQNTTVNCAVNMLTIRNVNPEMSNANNYIISADNGGSGRTTTVTVRRPLDNGSINAKPPSTGTLTFKTRENSGTTGNFNATTSTVTHQLAYTPVASDIVLTALTTLGLTNTLFVSGITATQFVINADPTPGQNINVAWKARKN